MALNPKDFWKSYQDKQREEQKTFDGSSFSSEDSVSSGVNASRVDASILDNAAMERRSTRTQQEPTAKKPAKRTKTVTAKRPASTPVTATDTATSRADSTAIAESSNAVPAARTTRAAAPRAKTTGRTSAKATSSAVRLGAPTPSLNQSIPPLDEHIVVEDSERGLPDSGPRRNARHVLSADALRSIVETEKRRSKRGLEEESEESGGESSFASAKDTSVLSDDASRRASASQAKSGSSSVANASRRTSRTSRVLGTAALKGIAEAEKMKGQNADDDDSDGSSFASVGQHDSLFSDLNRTTSRMEDQPQRGRKQTAKQTSQPPRSRPIPPAGSLQSIVDTDKHRQAQDADELSEGEEGDDWSQASFDSVSRQDSLFSDHTTYNSRSMMARDQNSRQTQARDVRQNEFPIRNKKQLLGPAALRSAVDTEHIRRSRRLDSRGTALDALDANGDASFASISQQDSLYSDSVHESISSRPYSNVSIAQPLRNQRTSTQQQASLNRRKPVPSAASLLGAIQTERRHNAHPGDTDSFDDASSFASYDDDTSQDNRILRPSALDRHGIQSAIDTAKRRTTVRASTIDGSVPDDDASSFASASDADSLFSDQVVPVKLRNSKKRVRQEVYNDSQDDPSFQSMSQQDTLFSDNLSISQRRDEGPNKRRAPLDPKSLKSVVDTARRRAVAPDGDDDGPNADDDGSSFASVMDQDSLFSDATIGPDGRQMAPRRLALPSSYALWHDIDAERGRNRSQDSSFASYSMNDTLFSEGTIQDRSSRGRELPNPYDLRNAVDSELGRRTGDRSMLDGSSFASGERDSLFSDDTMMSGQRQTMELDLLSPHALRKAVDGELGRSVLDSSGFASTGSKDTLYSQSTAKSRQRDPTAGLELPSPFTLRRAVDAEQGRDHAYDASSFASVSDRETLFSDRTAITEATQMSGMDMTAEESVPSSMPKWMEGDMAGEGDSEPYDQYSEEEQTDQFGADVASERASEAEPSVTEGVFLVPEVPPRRKLPPPRKTQAQQYVFQELKTPHMHGKQLRKRIPHLDHYRNERVVYGYNDPQSSLPGIIGVVKNMSEDLTNKVFVEARNRPNLPEIDEVPTHLSLPVMTGEDEVEEPQEKRVIIAKPEFRPIVHQHQETQLAEAFGCVTGWIRIAQGAQQHFTADPEQSKIFFVARGYVILSIGGRETRIPPLGSFVVPPSNSFSLRHGSSKSNVAAVLSFVALEGYQRPTADYNFDAPDVELEAALPTDETEVINS